MPSTAETAPPALTSADIFARQQEIADNAKPTIFRLGAQLLDQGRTDTPLAVTDDLTLRLKVYASGGENELHAHPQEDHVFVILQGSARFYGPEGEESELGAYEGIMLPKGTFYWFTATSEEPLVLIRVGTPDRSKQSEPYRINRDGEPMEGDSKENKKVPVVFREGAYFGAPPE